MLTLAFTSKAEAWREIDGKLRHVGRTQGGAPLAIPTVDQDGNVVVSQEQADAANDAAAETALAAAIDLAPIALPV